MSSPFDVQIGTHGENLLNKNLRNTLGKLYTNYVHQNYLQYGGVHGTGQASTWKESVASLLEALLYLTILPSIHLSNNSSDIHMWNLILAKTPGSRRRKLWNKCVYSGEARLPDSTA